MLPNGATGNAAPRESSAANPNAIALSALRDRGSLSDGARCAAT
ncbi:hypothetical protein SAMN04515678_11226 [Roseivivax sediminis]|uniref:Uncharacterized protein n=1 Tax=Roseivivax sediminis TaxID=936889 RepID=A0A1I2BXJ3_9RHOB|nr:hypothetical protein SAMN04515678_11226 [Roseivivax sediminis]